jgi:Methyltransferase domain
MKEILIGSRDRIMGDYTQMSSYYDVIMTSGYYDYHAIVDHITHFDRVNSVLEIGAGTGLILEQLVARRPDLEITGVDLTRSMLDIAAKRLKAHPQIALSLQNVVTLSLDQEYDLAFSYGGVWYFVYGEDQSFMVSHIRDEEENRQGLERLADCVRPGGTLLLGIQSPHFDYEKPISNGMKYSQRIARIDDGFRKDYYLKDNGRVVMAQTLDYRTYSFDDAIELLDECGFEYVERKGMKAQLFREFRKR